MMEMKEFEEKKKEWREKEDYEVKFIESYGKEIGRRGIMKRKEVNIDELKDNVIKDVIGKEESRLLEN